MQTSDKSLCIDFPLLMHQALQDNSQISIFKIHTLEERLKQEYERGKGEGKKVHTVIKYIILEHFLAI